MSTMVPMYGFGGGSGSTGATLTVTAPAGCTVTVSKDGKSKTKVAGADGKAVFKGLKTGEWTLRIAEGEQTYGRTIHITADYTENFQVFAYIHITYPAGSTCTATDGVTTITAPDTSGTWECVVPNAGTWTVSLDSGFTEKVDVTSSGQTISLKSWHLYNAGVDCTAVTGGWTAVAKKTQSDSVATATKPTITKGTDYIKFSIGADQSGIVYTTKKVSLNGINTIKVTGTLKNGGTFTTSLKMVAWSAIGTYANDNVSGESYTVNPGGTATSMSMDAGSLTGSYYIGFSFNTRKGSSSYVTINEFSLIC